MIVFGLIGAMVVHIQVTVNLRSKKFINQQTKQNIPLLEKVTRLNELWERMLVFGISLKHTENES